MQLNEHTTQAELARLYTAVTRRELLRSTPLNVGMFLRYAVLFVLFPGMVGGFRVGLGATLACCALLVGLLLGGQNEWAVLAVRVWLSAGVCVLAWVSCGTVRAALALYRLRGCNLPAEGAYGAAAPAVQKLRWHREHEVWAAEMECGAPATGICALMLQVEGAGKGRLLTPERRGVCMVQSAAKDDLLQTLLLYRLEQGSHRLRWVFVPSERCSTPPKGSVSVLVSPRA